MAEHAYNPRTEEVELGESVYISPSGRMRCRPAWATGNLASRANKNKNRMSRPSVWDTELGSGISECLSDLASFSFHSVFQVCNHTLCVSPLYSPWFYLLVLTLWLDQSVSQMCTCIFFLPQKDQQFLIFWCWGRVANM